VPAAQDASVGIFEVRARVLIRDVADLGLWEVNHMHVFLESFDLLILSNFTPDSHARPTSTPVDHADCTSSKFAARYGDKGLIYVHSKPSAKRRSLPRKLCPLHL